MHEFLLVIILALFPAFGNFAGGLLAEWLRPSKKILNRALHAAAGIILAIVSIEVMPTALKNAPPWLLAGMFMAGGCFYLLIEAGIQKWQRTYVGSGAWMIYMAVAADLVGDGLLIGSGSAVSLQMGLILALGQVLADVPEGFAVIANFRDKGMNRMQRIMLSASFAIPVVGAALLAYLLVRDQGEAVKVGALVFVAGLYCLAAMEDMLREAHKAVEDTRWSAISFLSGFALFLIVSGYFGS